MWNASDSSITLRSPCSQTLRRRAAAGAACTRTRAAAPNAAPTAPPAATSAGSAAACSAAGRATAATAAERPVPELKRACTTQPAARRWQDHLRRGRARLHAVRRGDPAVNDASLERVFAVFDPVANTDTYYPSWKISKKHKYYPIIRDTLAAGGDDEAAKAAIRASWEQRVRRRRALERRCTCTASTTSMARCALSSRHNPLGML